MRDKIKKFLNKFKLAFLISILLGILAGLIYVLYFTDFFVLQRIVVENNQRVSKKEIIKLTGLKGGERLFRIPLKEIRDRILINNYIEDVVLARRLPDTLEVIVKERKPLALIKTKGKLYLVDAKGVIIGEALPQDKNFYPVLELKNKDFEKKFLKFLEWIKESSRYLPVYANLSRVILGEDKIYFYTKRGFVIYFPLVCEKDWKYLYRNLDRVLTYIYEKKLADKVQLIRMDYPLGAALIKFRSHKDG